MSATSISTAEGHRCHAHGFDVMNGLRKGRAAPCRHEDGVMGEVHLINS
jgi:hypothetical protein